MIAPAGGEQNAPFEGAGSIAAGACREKPVPRIGLIVADPLRLLGLQAILGEGTCLPSSVLSERGVLPAKELDVVLIDAAVEEDVFGLLELFCGIHPQERLVLLGETNEPDYIQRAIGAGAKGYLHYGASETELKMAIEVVVDSSVWAPRKVLARLVEHARERRAAPPAAEVRLTKRELEVLRLLMLGQPNRRIAESLGVDEGTIKAHLGRLMRKAGVFNRTALSMRVLEDRWLDAS